jgi:hypothetical protein
MPPRPRAGEAITHKIMAPELVSILFLVVALSMALTPFLAAGGARLSKAFDKGDMKARPPGFRVLLAPVRKCMHTSARRRRLFRAFDKGDMKARPPGFRVLLAGICTK